jgi:hypothetical protein
MGADIFYQLIFALPDFTKLRLRSAGLIQSVDVATRSMTSDCSIMAVESSEAKGGLFGSLSSKVDCDVQRGEKKNEPKNPVSRPMIGGIKSSRFRR